MASIFKRSKKKTDPYTIQYKDHLGKRVTVKGFTDKGLSEQLAAKLEGEVRQRQSGMIDVEQEAFQQQKQLDIHTHVADYAKTLNHRTGKHQRLTLTRIRKLIAVCGYTKLAEITRQETLQGFNSLKQEQNLGARTYNHYIQAFDSFCNWCVANDRLARNPIIGMQRLNTATDIRHKRRALSPAEIQLLISTTRTTGKVRQKLTAETRARIYTLAYMTGLRKSELASLTKGSFRLDQSPPVLIVEAACSKHRKEDTLPLHPALVQLLMEWLRPLKANQKLFPGLERKETASMTAGDLAVAGIKYQTVEGFADFHASGRHSFITQLLRNGTTLPEAKELARHSDVTMTMKYTHIGLEDQAQAVKNLPAICNTKPDAEERVALQMRCIPAVSKEQYLAMDGKSDLAINDKNPGWNRGSDTTQHRMAISGQVLGAGIEPA